MTESATKLQQAAVRVRVAKRLRERAQREADTLKGQLEHAEDELRAARREEDAAARALQHTALDASPEEQEEALWALPEWKQGPQGVTPRVLDRRAMQAGGVK